MTPDNLLHWLEGRLDEASAQQVARWVVSNPDPQLPALMRGLLRDAQQKRDDAAVRQAHPEAVWLLDAWELLLVTGRARLSVGEDAPIHVQFAGPTDDGAVLYLQEEGDILGCVWDGPREGRQGFMSDDAGGVQQLAFADDGYGSWRAEIPRPEEGRWTFWMVQSGGDDDAATRLRRALANPLGEAQAVRYDTRW